MIFRTVVDAGPYKGISSPIGADSCRLRRCARDIGNIGDISDSRESKIDRLSLQNVVVAVGAALRGRPRSKLQVLENLMKFFINLDKGKNLCYPNRGESFSNIAYCAGRLVNLGYRNRRYFFQKRGSSSEDPLFIRNFRNYLTVFPFSFWMTSCAPPSTMEVADTRVRTAFSCSSGMVSAPQLHMVDLTLARDMATLSFRLPA